MPHQKSIYSPIALAFRKKYRDSSHVISHKSMIVLVLTGLKLEQHKWSGSILGFGGRVSLHSHQGIHVSVSKILPDSTYEWNDICSSGVKSSTTSEPAVDR